MSARVACGSASQQRAGAWQRVRQRVAAACEVWRESEGVVCGAQTAAASRAVRARQRQRGCAPATSRTTSRGGSFLRERGQVAAGKCKRERVTQTRRTWFIFQPSTVHRARRPRAPGSLQPLRSEVCFLFRRKRVRVARSAPPLLRTSVFGPGTVGARATAAKMRAAGSANTRGGARGGVESWRRGGRFTFFEFSSETKAKPDAVCWGRRDLITL